MTPDENLRFDEEHADASDAHDAVVSGARAVAAGPRDAQATEIERLQVRLEAEEEARADLEQRLGSLEKVVHDQDDAQSATTRRRARSWFGLAALAALVAGGGAATLAVASIAGYWWDGFGRALGPAGLGSVIVWSGLVARHGRRRAHVDDWRVFRAFDRAAGNLWTCTGAVVVEIVMLLVALGGP